MCKKICYAAGMVTGMAVCSGVMFLVKSNHAKRAAKKLMHSSAGKLLKKMACALEEW